LGGFLFRRRPFENEPSFGLSCTPVIVRIETRRPFSAPIVELQPIAVELVDSLDSVAFFILKSWAQVNGFWLLFRVYLIDHFLGAAIVILDGEQVTGDDQDLVHAPLLGL